MHLYDHQHSAAYKTSTGNTYRGQCYRDKMTRYPLFCGSVSGTLILRSTHASALSRSMALTWSHFFLRQFHIGKNGFFHPPLWHPDRWSICQNHRGMPLCGYLLFRPETGQVSEEQMRQHQSAPERQPTGRI